MTKRSTCAVFMKISNRHNFDPRNENKLAVIGFTKTHDHLRGKVANGAGIGA